MRFKDWKKLIAESLFCDRCASQRLKRTRQSVLIEWSEFGKYFERVIRDVPAVTCIDCGEIHITNIAMSIMDRQRYSEKREVDFYEKGLVILTENKTEEEKCIEENYFFGVSFLGPNLKISKENITEDHSDKNKQLINGEMYYEC